MATLIVPPIDANESKDWPSLGDQVADWIEDNAVYGPGSRKGEPVDVDDEFHAWLIRTYQVHPKTDPARAGRRRFRQVSKEATKGTGKTEWAIIVAQAELHPDAPVRCVDWEWRGSRWFPVGGPVPNPKLAFIATSKDQVIRTAWGRFVQTMNASSPHTGLFHITNARIVLIGPDGHNAGEAFPLAVSGDSADGELPTWYHVDEPHRFDTPHDREMWDTIQENTLKDVEAQGWVLTTSTAGDLGADSVEEGILETAEAMRDGKLDRPGFFFHRRWAPEDMPLTSRTEIEEAVREGRGPAARWSGDIPAIVDRFYDPKADPEYLARVWLGQWVPGGGRAFNLGQWDARTDVDRTIPDGALVTLGFDGARRRDSTGIIATDIASGYQEVLGAWEHDPNVDDWEVPVAEVDAAMELAFDRFDVNRGYLDPPYWDEQIVAWSGRWGQKIIVSWWTNRLKAMAHAVRRHRNAIADGTLTHDGNPTLRRHIANARRLEINARDDRDQPLYVIRKDKPDSPRKIDLAMCSVLSWEARMDAIAAGALKRPKKYRAAGFGGRFA